jgi:hypothetical protein
MRLGESFPELLSSSFGDGMGGYVESRIRREAIAIATNP